MPKSDSTDFELDRVARGLVGTSGDLGAMLIAIPYKGGVLRSVIVFDPRALVDNAGQAMLCKSIHKAIERAKEKAQ